MVNNTQTENVLDQLATNMILQRPMPQPSPDHASMFRGLRGSRINQLQPQIQQVTPPFNLGKLFHFLFLHALLNLTVVRRVCAVS